MADIDYACDLYLYKRAYYYSWLVAILTNNKKSVEWYTPKWIFDELGLTFDLDPASPKDFETAVPANTKYTIDDDGLKKEWFGKIWLNPPYTRKTGDWIRKLIKHNNGIAIVFSRTDAKWFQDAMKSCTGVLFMAGRISFLPGKENEHKKGRAGAGTAMFAFGPECLYELRRLRSHGIFIEM